MNDAQEALRTESPCINVCVLDAANICLGCGRHLDDIAGWSQMTPAERHEANMQAQARRRAAAAKTT
jgi:predicted Fe-S protein YdhL (DUF1289 family)